MIETLLIIENERLNADRLVRLINILRPEIEIVGVIESIEGSMEWFSKNLPPDVILMDVQLSDGSTFELLDRVKVSSQVIFITAFDRHAIKAFKYNSVDYLLKPIDQRELQVALNKVDNILEEPARLSHEMLMHYLRPKDYRTRFLLPYKNGYKTILIEHIICFCSELKITYAKQWDGSVETIPQTLEELERQLNPRFFFRANRQYIVHIDAISHVSNDVNGKLKIYLKGGTGTDIIVSRDKSAQFKDWLDY
ncbi:LytTR family DNA-binding domain-containing protein [Chitinophaga pendula]|uniref:LytR/AlgR family response regulator transcription factor n=1 Tax=Chitinophaga TaxID=79328 RepID=UPI000BB009E7|nr:MULTISPECIES: LytTR family DNA-binding domain-containing protein [Chitinophaga]ASZ12125.1 DNA-binding response regulator [Chitinophaga sp. MD30]UCJ04836.1 LytTR family DNA-binding domain-containing protein [Chitinophaga pendula]